MDDFEALEVCLGASGAEFGVGARWGRVPFMVERPRKAVAWKLLRLRKYRAEMARLAGEGSSVPGLFGREIFRCER